MLAMIFTGHPTQQTRVYVRSASTTAAAGGRPPPPRWARTHHTMPPPAAAAARRSIPPEAAAFPAVAARPALGSGLPVQTAGPRSTTRYRV
eukprot:CAMPEP_0198698020 /NCGR_PEP_ID=MMETSP1468-20131203/331070_1 /TAXON_ID=1461545 /ORGANISM="Mantoniella sp, Strain CCMP1436" /LENGTH=90 /DNA_ID=CAMNT_0044454877 /DNA_START=430 /DNA_END=702 /DNA_ORIENTATION=-